MQTQVIFKYDVHAVRDALLEVPAGSEVLSAGFQEGLVKAWVLQPAPSEDQKTERIELFYVGTGWDLLNEPKNVFVGTVQTPSGFVWHVFARYLDRE